MESAAARPVGYFKDRTTAQEIEKPQPDFIIKFDTVNEPAPIGGCEESVCGTEADATEAVRRLVESGRTTPNRVRIYAHSQALVSTQVSFPSSRPPGR